MPSRGSQQAAEIERDAQRNAKEREQQLDARSQELVQGVVTRAASVLDSIELVQSAISGMLAELRAEVKALESGASGASPIDSSTRPQALIGTDQRIAKEAPAQPATPAQTAPTAPAEAEAALATQPPRADETATEPAAEPPADPQEEPQPADEQAGSLVEQAPPAAKAETGRAATAPPSSTR